MNVETNERSKSMLVTLFVLIAGLGVLLGAKRTVWSGEAFAAFYCAGEAVSQHADPYRIEPLRTCEHRVAPGVLAGGVVEPAPLPGYALAPFVALAHVPYRLASAAFVLVLLVAVAVSAVLLAEITGLPIAGTLGALLVVDGFINVFFGETPPLAVAALCVAARLTVARRDRLASVAAAMAMIEPHVGLAACLSLFVWRPQTRVVLLVFAFAFAVLSMLVVSPHGFVEYFAQALPLQTLSETSASDQYSFTWIAHVFYASDALASRLGSLSYAFSVAFGVLLSGRVARRLCAPALLVFFPCGVAMLFGVFVHDIELPAAMPAALVVAVALADVWAWAAVVVLTLEWLPSWNTDLTIVAVSVISVACVAGSAARESPPPRRLVYAACTPILYILLLLVLVHVPETPIGAPASAWPSLATLGPNAAAALNWGASVRNPGEPASLRLLLGKVLVWAALGFLFVGALSRRASREGDVREASRDRRSTLIQRSASRQGLHRSKRR